ncbi:Uncharacterised protein [Vibrio cholerae]|nr:Uncharacterised protein [Vibrio cholerae]
MGRDQVLLFQHLQDAANGFARTANNLTDLLASDLDLHAVRVSHRIWLTRKVQQSLSDTARYV